LAALNASTGDALSWTPDSLGPRYPGVPPGRCWALAVQKDKLYVVGFFYTFGGVSHPCTVALSRQTGLASSWDPKLQPWAYALAVQGDTVWIGGQFASVGEWGHRAGLAAIDLASGTLKPWNPNPDGTICTAVAVSGDRVFVSGDFTTIGGEPQPRSSIAALDTLKGEVAPWNPGADANADAFLLESDTLYAGGEFTVFGGQVRNHLAAVNATTGQVMSWNPNADGPVLAMQRKGDEVYLGGLFFTVSGQGRWGLAAVDANSGVVAPWNPGTDNSAVDALLVTGERVTVGGAFGTVGGLSRVAIAAVDDTAGNVLPWSPQVEGWGEAARVRALAEMDGRLYVGGRFSIIGDQPRICLAAVDTSSGLSTDWDPAADVYLAEDLRTPMRSGGE
jgi:hypothetical protein